MRQRRGLKVEGEIRPRLKNQRKVNLRVSQEVWSAFQDEADGRGLSVYAVMKDWLFQRVQVLKKKKANPDLCELCNRRR